MKGTFNAHEFGLNYRIVPGVKVATQRLPGRKKAKEHISVLSFTNAGESEKCEFMIIGSAWKPRPFKKKTGSEFGLDYHANKKAWIT